MTASRSARSPRFGVLLVVLAGMAGSTGCSGNTETSSDATPIAPGALHSALDANGDVDWNAVAAACQTLYDVATVSETEAYFACGEHGLLHLTPDGIDPWNPGAGIYYVKAASASDVRAITCHDVYHRGLLGGWSKEGTVGDQTSGCATTLGTGGGGWFSGVWHPVPGYGELWRLEGGKWVGQTSKYNFGLDGAFFKLAVIGKNEAIVPVTSPSGFVVHAKFDPFDKWKVVNQTRLGGEAVWRASDTRAVYVSSGFDGIFSSKGNDVYTQEWDPAQGVVLEIWGRSGREIYAVGRQGLFASSKGDGKWTETRMANGAELEFIWPWNGKVVVADRYNMYPAPPQP
ncbi:hypothetical protein LVJ94_26130 [Pendulispora rubella]|uniref:Uncharacterized protein n=1 Tax=Pendulispora rubella TaxID=2741070 RepID=A0ABZ2KRP0_9BACT